MNNEKSEKTFDHVELFFEFWIQVFSINRVVEGFWRLIFNHDNFSFIFQYYNFIIFILYDLYDVSELKKKNILEFKPIFNNFHLILWSHLNLTFWLPLIYFSNILSENKVLFLNFFLTRKSGFMKFQHIFLCIFVENITRKDSEKNRRTIVKKNPTTPTCELVA